MDVQTNPQRNWTEWNHGKLRAFHSKPEKEYTLYHKDQEGRIELTYKELCQMSEMIERMIADAK